MTKSPFLLTIHSKLKKHIKMSSHFCGLLPVMLEGEQIWGCQ
jgi:hypothetical protein